MGLAPSYKTGGCNKDCSEMLSACLMAHVNSSGTHIPLWMASPDSLGWGTSSWFPTREGTFFGQMMVTNTAYNLDAYYCNGPGSDDNVVPGRLGANQGAVPYANAWPKTAGFDGLCETNHVDRSGYDHGKCTPHYTDGVIDGDSSCVLNGATYNHPVTVWRGATFQAEAAEGGGFINGVWTKGAYGFNASNCSTPGQNGCALIKDTNNGMDYRVGFIGPNKGLKFTGVNVAASGTANLVVYYTNGDAYNLTRYLQFIVNGGAPQVVPFGGIQDWSHPRGSTVQLTGFKAGSDNTIYVTADATHAAPDLDWIEIVGTNSGVPATGVCQPSLWSVSASVNGGAAGNLTDGDLAARYTTGRTMQAGDYIQVDFRGLVNIASITLNNTYTSGGDYAAAYSVYTSQDGVNFSSTPVMTGAGAQDKTVIPFAQESMRAVRIKVTGATSKWWSVGELQADCSL
jgi:hypothetical protein